MPSNTTREINKVRLECDEALNDALCHLDDMELSAAVERTEKSLQFLFRLQDLKGMK